MIGLNCKNRCYKLDSVVTVNNIAAVSDQSRHGMTGVAVIRAWNGPAFQGHV